MVGNGIYYNSIINKRQKTNTIIIHLVTTLKEDTASANAIIPYLLASSSKTYPTITALNKKLSELYGSAFKGAVSKMGNSQTLSLMAGCINNRYTFEGENITEELVRLMVDALINPNFEDNGFSRKDF